MSYWKIVLKWILFLFIFIVGYYGINRLIAPSRAIQKQQIMIENQPVTNHDSLRVGAYNVAHGRGGALGASNFETGNIAQQKEHFGRIAEQINTADLDIIVLNEIDFRSVWSYHFNQAEWLAEELQFPHLIEHRIVDVRFPIVSVQGGNAVLSKYPIVEMEHIPFDEPLNEWEARFAGNHDGAIVTVNTPQGIVDIVVIHLESRSETVRVSAVKQLLDYLEDRPYPAIWAGDFNSTRYGYENTQLSENNENAMSLLLEQEGLTTWNDVENTAEWYTFPSESPWILIDWILVNERASVVDGRVIPSEYSDHFMVIAEIEIILE